MIKYKRTFGDKSIAMEFETMEQLLEYIRLEKEGATVSFDMDNVIGDFMDGSESDEIIRKNVAEIKNSTGDTIGFSVWYKTNPMHEHNESAIRIESLMSIVVNRGNIPPRGTIPEILQLVESVGGDKKLVDMFIERAKEDDYKSEGTILLYILALMNEAV